MKSEVFWHDAAKETPQFTGKHIDNYSIECLVIVPTVNGRFLEVMCMSWEKNKHARSEKGRTPRWKWRDRLAPWEPMYWAYKPAIPDEARI